MRNIIKGTKSGFTLIEVIVVMAVFLFIIGTAIGIFISVVQQQKRILAEQKIINQISYATEYMSKALRMAGKETDACLQNSQGESGYVYALTRQDISTGSYRGIKFVNQSDNNACQEFYLDSVSNVIMEIKNGNDVDAIPLTSTDLQINSLAFIINGNTNQEYYYALRDDNIQPRITILISARAKAEPDSAPLKIQTTISQRDLNTE